MIEIPGVEQSIFLAPLGGGPSTPAIAAAVANAGGLGAIAAAYLTPTEIADTIRKTRTLTGRPLNVNLFAGGYHATTSQDTSPMLAAIAEVHRELGLPQPRLPEIPPDPFAEQFEAILAAKPMVFSFTFGIPSSDVIERAKRAGMLVFGTATTVAEGRLLEAAGADAVVAQGSEAGGQRGTFDVSFEAGLVPLMELISGLVESLRVPVIASGGIMDGHDIARVLKAGASAAQLGTAFLCCPESGASAAYKQALHGARDGQTAITYAFTGRAARGLENRFTRSMADRRTDTLPFPIQNFLTRDLRQSSAKRGDSEFLSLWAGTGVARMRAIPAAELMQILIEETRVAMTENTGAKT